MLQEQDNHRICLLIEQPHEINFMLVTGQFLSILPILSLPVISELVYGWVGERVHYVMFASEASIMARLKHIQSSPSSPSYDHAGRGYRSPTLPWAFTVYWVKRKPGGTRILYALLFYDKSGRVWQFVSEEVSTPRIMQFYRHILFGPDYPLRHRDPQPHPLRLIKDRINIHESHKLQSPPKAEKHWS